MAGRTLAYRSKWRRRLTLIEVKPPPTGVVSGLFSATLLRAMESRVSFGIRSPCFSSATTPASANSYSRPAPSWSSTCRVASMISGPMPSPRMTVIFWVMWICPDRRDRPGNGSGHAGREKLLVKLCPIPPEYPLPPSDQAGALPRPGPMRSAVVVGLGLGGCPCFQGVQEVHGAAQVGDDDRAAHHQADGEGLEELLAGDPGLPALGHVVADAVVTAQHQRRDQAQQLLGLHVQRAGLVGLGIQGEEAAHHLVRLGQDALVHALAELGELADAVVTAHAPASGAWPSSSGSRRPARCRAIMS